MNIAVIPARSGSKRIKNKNIKSFCKKPIIYWSIRAARKSKIFKKIYVSTDSKKIANVAKRFGAEVPFLRSRKLSNDKAGTSAVIRDFINRINNKIKFKNICCIYPAAPFVKSSDIKKGYTILKNKKYNYVFSATKYSSNFHRAFIIKKKNQMKMLVKKNYKKRTQDLPHVYLDAAQFYWAKKKTWLKKKKVFNKNSTVIEIPKERSCDIDTLEDWKHAEKLSYFHR